MKVNLCPKTKPQNSETQFQSAHPRYCFWNLFTRFFITEYRGKRIYPQIGYFPDRRSIVEKTEIQFSLLRFLFYNFLFSSTINLIVFLFTSWNYSKPEYVYVTCEMNFPSFVHVMCLTYPITITILYYNIYTITITILYYDIYINYIYITYNI